MNRSDTRERIINRIYNITGEVEHRSGLDQAFEKLIEERPCDEQKLASISNKIQAFTAAATASFAEVITISCISELPEVIENMCSPEVALSVAPQPVFSELQWLNEVQSDYCRGEAVGMVCARAGIAETGSVCLSSSDVPSGLLFLVNTLVVLVRTSTLVSRQEEAWPLLRGQGRSAHIITGPSRTADVEQEIHVGAHGPRRLLIVVWTGLNMS